MAKSRLTGVQKAALLVMSMDEDKAAKLLANIGDDALTKLRRAVESLGDTQIPGEEKYAILLKFAEKQGEAALYLGDASARFEKALERVRDAGEEHEIKRSADEGKQNSEDRRDASDDESSIDSIENVDLEDLAKAISQESPRCSAILLSALPGEKAGQLLDLVDPELRELIVKKVVSFQKIPNEVVEEVVRGFMERLSETRARNRELTEEERVEELVNLISSLARESQAGMLKAIREQDQEMAEKVERNIFSFEGLAMVKQKSLQQLLGKVDAGTIALAIKGLDQDLRTLIVSNLSNRMRDMVNDESELIGSVLLSKAMEARDRIMLVAKEMDSAGLLEFGDASQEERYVE